MGSERSFTENVEHNLANFINFELWLQLMKIENSNID